MRTTKLPRAAVVFAGLLAAGCQDLPTQDLPATRSSARDPGLLPRPVASQFGCAVVYRVVGNGRDKRRLGKLHAPYLPAEDGSRARHKVIIKDAKSHAVVLTADCTLPNTPQAVSGLYRAFHVAEPARSVAAPSASKSTHKPVPPNGPRFNTEPVLLPGLTVVGYRESGYHENWAVDNYGWGSYGDTYHYYGPTEEPEWWYETDEGNDDLPTYCHSTDCTVHTPDYNEQVKLWQEIWKIRSEGSCGKARGVADRYLSNTPSQIKLWNGEVRDSAGYIIAGDFLRGKLPEPPEIHLSVDYGMTAASITHEALHALGLSHGYTEKFADGVTRVFGAKSSDDTMSNYCG